MRLSDRELAIMQQSVAWPKCYRNHFAAVPSSPDGEVCARLTEQGYMVRGTQIPGGLVYYHVTEKGQSRLEDMRREL